jgi:AcrR family transcriptional regulator
MPDDIGLRGYRVQDPARASARRREIMLAMADVISDKGYAATTLEDVATRIGTSRAVIYYQFRSKEDLYVALVLDAVAFAADRLQAIIERNLPPDQTLRAALRDLIDVGSDPINRSTLMTGRPLSLAPASRRRIRTADREYESRFQAILEQGIEAGIFVPRDARFLMYTLIMTTNQSFILRRSGRYDATLFSEDLPEMLLNSVLTHPCDYHPHGEAPPNRPR